MGLASEAFKGLFPEMEFDYDVKIKYSRKFSDYNANVRYRGKNLWFGLSYKWKSVSREIRIGLIQSLLLKVLKEKKSTTNIDLYNMFLKNVHISAPKYTTEPFLEESFNRVNENFFYGLIEKPNLAWTNSINKLGSYEYGTDTISISPILKNRKEALDYVMYHEMLHKKYKFRHKKGRNYHHTKEFRKKEKEFPDAEKLEQELKGLITKNKVKRFFRFF